EVDDPGQVTTRDVDATSACADGQRQATVRVGCTRPAVGHTGARVFGVAPDVFDALIFDQGDIIVDPVVVGAEDQRLVADLALQPFLGQGGALVRPVVFVAEQGDVLIEAQRSQRGCQLDTGLGCSDDQQPGGLASGRCVGSGVGGFKLWIIGYNSHGCYTWVSGVVTCSSVSAPSLSWQDSRELSSRSSVVP